MRSGATLSHVRSRGNGGAGMRSGGARTARPKVAGAVIRPSNLHRTRAGGETFLPAEVSPRSSHRVLPRRRPHLRKILIAALAALTAFAAVSIANAQDPEETPGATVEVTLSPKKAGKKKRPKPVKVNLTLINE